MTTINGNLVMEKDMEFKNNLFVKGSIFGKDGNKYNLKVRGNLSAIDINAYNISAKKINVGDINVNNITAQDIISKNIQSVDINARDINAIDINARDIVAINIDALDINSNSINANNIVYYGVCFAYYDIKCRSIIGRDMTSRHFSIKGGIYLKVDDLKFD